MEQKIMKKILMLGGLLGLLVGGCTKNNNTELLEKFASLEKRIETLEKDKLAAAAARPAAPPVQTTAYDVPVGSSYVLGNPTAPLTLVKFSDYECPFCARANDSFVKAIEADPELSKQVKVVYKHFPLSFHKNARSASKFALAAGEQGHDCFWKMTEKLYAGQRELSEDNYKKWSKEVTCKNKDGKVVALNADKVWKDYKANDAKYEESIKADTELGMKVGVRGTPTFLMNGWKIDERTVEGAKKLITEKGLLTAGK
jgi:protein-disulfide isomerase